MALLLGRRTYEGFAAAWPSREGEFADKFNGMPKYVVSSTLSDPDWIVNTTVLERATSPRRSRGCATRSTATSSSTAAPSSSRRCSTPTWSTSCALMVFPLVLGAGKRLLGPTGDTKALTLASTHAAVGDGVTINVYTPAAA